jgi:archaellum biogenesis protein FlaJ (TadC family)
MKALQLISGIVLMIIGIGLICVPLFVQKPFTFFTLLYGIPLLIIGIFILVNKKEEEIEKIKTQR